MSRSDLEIFEAELERITKGLYYYCVGDFEFTKPHVVFAHKYNERSASRRCPHCEAKFVRRNKPSPRSTRPSMLYLVEDVETKNVKIGLSSNPASRMSALQTGSPNRLRLVAAIPGELYGEQQLHAKFNHLRLRDAGEWFTNSPDIYTAFGVTA